MRKIVVCFSIVLVCLLSACGNTVKPDFKYDKMLMMSGNLDEVMKDMVEISFMDLNSDIYSKKLEDILYKLNMNQLELDALPEFEKDPAEQGAKDFNLKYYAPREISTQLQDIQYLFYDAMVSRNPDYLNTVVRDKALPVRLEYLKARCQNNGLFQPLPEQYRNLPLGGSGSGVDIEIEQSIF